MDFNNGKQIRKRVMQKPWEGQYIKDYLDNLKISDEINSAYCAKKDQLQQYPNIQHLHEVLEEYIVNEGMYSWEKCLRNSGFASKALQIAGIIKPFFKIKLDKSEGIKLFWFI